MFTRAKDPGGMAQLMGNGGRDHDLANRSRNSSTRPRWPSARTGDVSLTTITRLLDTQTTERVEIREEILDGGTAKRQVPSE